MNCNLNEVHSSHVLSTKFCSDCVRYSFVVIVVLHQRSGLLEFTRFSDLGLLFESFLPLLEL